MRRLLSLLRKGSRFTRLWESPRVPSERYERRPCLCVCSTFRPSDFFTIRQKRIRGGSIRTLNVTAGHWKNIWYWGDPAIVSLPRLDRRETMGLLSSTRQPHTQCALSCTAAGRQRGGRGGREGTGREGRVGEWREGVGGEGVGWEGWGFLGEGRGGEGKGGEGRGGDGRGGEGRGGEGRGGEGSYAEKKYWTRKTMISTGLPYLQFSMNSPGFSPARLTWPAYDGGRKRENSSAWKHRIIVASICRRSVEFGRYVTWLWMANCLSVMKKNAA